MKKIVLFLQYTLCLFSCTLLLAQNTVFAQEPQSTSESHERWYQVEMIVFSRNAKTTEQEVWPNTLTLSYPNNMVSLKPIGSNDANGFVMLSSAERLLNAQAATIAKSGSYTLLFHQAWRQMIVAKNTSLFINGGKTFNGHQELEGSIDLSVGQFLKFKTNLWLTQFSLRTATMTKDSWPELPALPNAELDTTATTSAVSDYVTERIVKINQQRSMRSVEVHYIDHPLLGIIVKIIPVDLSNPK